MDHTNKDACAHTHTHTLLSTATFSLLWLTALTTTNPRQGITIGVGRTFDMEMVFVVKASNVGCAIPMGLCGYVA
jgi:hypothetical protein